MIYSCATKAHLGSGELLRAASLREVVRESKARSQTFLLLLFFTEDTEVPWILLHKIICDESLRVMARPIRTKLVRNNLTTEYFWATTLVTDQTFYKHFTLMLS